MRITTNSLAGRRVLVVEDDTLIALLVEEILQELGCIVIGPVGKLDAALLLAADALLDAAVLDVNIRGGHVFPAAELLQTRGIPFMLASGYGNWALPPAFRDQPRLTKPFSHSDFETQLRLLLDQSGGIARPATSAA